MRIRRSIQAAVLLAGLAIAGAARADDNPGVRYGQVVEGIRKELAIPFSDPDDPGLYERRQRLKKLFLSVPDEYAHALLERLGESATGDELSRKFHGTLHPATIAELLNILRIEIEPEASPSPAATPAPVLVWPTRPLPSSEKSRFDNALAKLETLVAASGDPRAWRYKCWFEKLKQGGDDRVIRWGAICPQGGAIGAAYIVGACDLGTGVSLKEQDDLQRAITSVPDVPVAGPGLGIITHLRADIVVSQEMTALPLENLRLTHDGVIAAIDKLDKWANNPMGGSSAMPTAYVSIKDWIGQQQGDSNSVYSCQ